MLPFHDQILIAPGHTDPARFEISPVLPNLRYVQSESTAHRLGDRHPDRLLRLAGLGPKALDELVTVLDFDERPARLVARAPKRHELLVWLELPVRRG